MDFDDLKWQSPKALRGKDSVAPELLNFDGHFLVGDFTQAVDDGEPGPSRWSFVPEEAYQRPPQLLAAQLIRDPERDIYPVARVCQHETHITINRGGDFCSENCRKDWERLSKSQRNYINIQQAAGKVGIFDRIVAKSKKKASN